MGNLWFSRSPLLLFLLLRAKSKKSTKITFKKWDCRDKGGSWTGRSWYTPDQRHKEEKARGNPHLLRVRGIRIRFIKSYSWCIQLSSKFHIEIVAKVLVSPPFPFLQTSSKVSIWKEDAQRICFCTWIISAECSMPWSLICQFYWSCRLLLYFTFFLYILAKTVLAFFVHCLTLRISLPNPAIWQKISGEMW
jgi:hypothetical protein